MPCPGMQDDVQAMNDNEFLSALLRIRQKDAAIYDSNLEFFDNETEQPKAPRQAMVSGGKVKRPLYLRDIVAQQVGGAHFSNHNECAVDACVVDVEDVYTNFAHDVQSRAGDCGCV